MTQVYLRFYKHINAENEENTFVIGGDVKRVLTRIPRNAVSRLPALFHKIEGNL